MQVDDIFSPKSAWSPEQWQQQRGYTCQEANPSLNVNQTQKPEDALYQNKVTFQPTPNSKRCPRRSLIANLKLAVQADALHGLSSTIFHHFGRKAKDTIDYLMKKHNIKNGNSESSNPDISLAPTERNFPGNSGIPLCVFTSTSSI